MRPFPSPQLRDAYLAGSKDQQALMNRLRNLVFETAAGLEGIGTIEESLKWGQPTFSTIRPKTGSPFRIAPVKDSDKKVGLYFICTTSLVHDFREQYAAELAFEGNRAIIMDTGDKIPVEAISHCMALALTYNRRHAQTSS